MKSIVAGTIVLLAFTISRPQGAQSTKPGAGVRGAESGRGAGFGALGRGVTQGRYDDYTGFTSLWDGRTLTGWDGESDVWSIDNGAIHADTTKTPGQHHLHYIGPGAVMHDFDIKVEFKISATGANGGIQYRSRLLYAPHNGSIENPLGKDMPKGVTTLQAAIAAGLAEPVPSRGGGPANAPPQPAFRNPWQVSGYQFDLDSENRYTGQLYEGQGRGIVNPPGGFVELLPGGNAVRIGGVSANPTAAIKPHRGLDGEWQQAEVIARGSTLVHMLNGQVMSVTVDDDPSARAHQGILSLQLEGSGQIWYRNVYLKTFGQLPALPK
ncbi:MAG TPA: DUF1080 domain-containing protein [Vicinamibacterales bacterium]|jgi:hypothetical protein